MRMISRKEDVILAFKREAQTLHNQSTSNTVPCNNEEVDTRVLLHARDIASNSGIPHVFIKTIDTDVLINTIALFLNLILEKLRKGFGSGLKRMNIRIHVIHNHLGDYRLDIYGL